MKHRLPGERGAAARTPGGAELGERQPLSSSRRLGGPFLVRVGWSGRARQEGEREVAGQDGDAALSIAPPRKWAYAQAAVRRRICDALDQQVASIRRQQRQSAPEQRRHHTALPYGLQVDVGGQEVRKVKGRPVAAVNIVSCHSMCAGEAETSAVFRCPCRSRAPDSDVWPEASAAGTGSAFSRLRAALPRQRQDAKRRSHASVVGRTFR